MTKYLLSNRRLLLTPPADNPLWASHAQAPTILELSSDCWLIFFAGRDSCNRSRVFVAELDPGLMKIREIRTEPVLDLGLSGQFDEHGVGPGTAVKVDDKIHLYYSGVQQCSDVPYHVAIGLSRSTLSDLNFIRLEDQPVLGAKATYCHGATTPTVWREGNKWHMLLSVLRPWRKFEDTLESVYDLHSAVSEDGLHWTLRDAPILGFSEGLDGGLIRGQYFLSPSGLKLLVGERNWYNYRADQAGSYRFRLASSTNKQNWLRNQDSIILDPPSQSNDWDSEMQCYPWLVLQGDKLLVFYNGNDFGRHGLGVGELVEAED